MIQSTAMAWALPFIFPLLISSSNAVPSMLVPRDLSADSSCQDLEAYQSSHGGALEQSMWQDTWTGAYMIKWNENNQNSTNFAFDFASQFGIGQSFKCRITEDCNTPNCHDLENPGDKGTAAAYQVLVSLSNLQHFFSKLFDSVNIAYGQWGSMQVAIQQKYWPTAKDDSLFLKDFLVGLSAMVGVVAGIAGGPALGTVAPLVGAMGGIISNSLTTTDKSLANIASDEEVALAFYNSTFQVIEDTNDDLMSKQSHMFSDTGPLIDIPTLFLWGNWSDFRGIPILNSDPSQPQVKLADLKNMFYGLILGQVINYSWKQQGIYIVKIEMSQDEYNNLKSPYQGNDDRVKVYYNGAGYFFQGIDKQTAGGAPVNGWTALPDDMFGLTAQDVLRSSADTWATMGYGSSFSLDDVRLVDPKDLMGTGAKMGGFWTIPICIPDQKQHDDQGGWDKVLDGSTGDPWIHSSRVDFSINYPPWCGCRHHTDGAGKVFQDQFSDDIKDFMNKHCPK